VRASIVASCAVGKLRLFFGKWRSRFKKIRIKFSRYYWSAD